MMVAGIYIGIIAWLVLKTSVYSAADVLHHLLSYLPTIHTWFMHNKINFYINKMVKNLFFNKSSSMVHMGDTRGGIFWENETNIHKKYLR